MGNNSTVESVSSGSSGGVDGAGNYAADEYSTHQ